MAGLEVAVAATVLGPLITFTLATTTAAVVAGAVAAGGEEDEVVDGAGEAEEVEGKAVS